MHQKSVIRSQLKTQNNRGTRNYPRFLDDLKIRKWSIKQAKVLNQ